MVLIPASTERAWRYRTDHSKCKHSREEGRAFRT